MRACNNWQRKCKKLRSFRKCKPLTRFESFCTAPRSFEHQVNHLRLPQEVQQSYKCRNPPQVWSIKYCKAQGYTSSISISSITELWSYIIWHQRGEGETTYDIIIHSKNLFASLVAKPMLRWAIKYNYHMEVDYFTSQTTITILLSSDYFLQNLVRMCSYCAPCACNCT